MAQFNIANRKFPQLRIFFHFHFLQLRCEVSAQPTTGRTVYDANLSLLLEERSRALKQEVATLLREKRHHGKLVTSPQSPPVLSFSFLTRSEDASPVCPFTLIMILYAACIACAHTELYIVPSCSFYSSRTQLCITK